MPSKELVLITGSSGRIGSALIHRLAARYEIIGFDDAGPPYPPRPAHCIPVDMESDNSVAEALKHVREKYGSRLASVVHLAGYYSFSGDPDPRYYTVNVLGTRRLLLGWEPQRRLLGTLSLMVYFLRQNPAAWYKANKLEAPADLQERAAPPKAEPACRPDEERPRS